MMPIARSAPFVALALLALGLSSAFARREKLVTPARDASAMPLPEVEPALRAVSTLVPSEPARAPVYEPAPMEPSHPISDEHERLSLVQRLVGALNDALDAKDALRMRDLLERYDEADPEDPQELREGFERIADCLAGDGEVSPSARANAQRYYERARASTLRRYVRRHCLQE